MKKKLLIFDLDGTLINTVKDLNEAVNYALRTFNYPARSLEQTRRDIGNGVAMLIARSIENGKANPDYEKCLLTFKAYYREHYFDYSRPYPGVKETVEKLKELGYKLAVVSNKFDEGAKKLINHYFPGLFDFIQGESPKFKTKPSPEMIQNTLESLRIDVSEALYIGDTEVDFESANNTKMDVVLVSYGYRNKQELKDKIKSEPVIIDSLSELINLLNQ